MAIYSVFFSILDHSALVFFIPGLVYSADNGSSHRISNNKLDMEVDNKDDDDAEEEDDDDDDEDGGKEVFASRSCYRSTFHLTSFRRKFNFLRLTSSSFHARAGINKINKILLSKLKLKYRLTPR